MIPIIGIHGRAGAGKDTVLERIQALAPGRFERVSFADPLKRSAAALFGITVDDLELAKRDKNSAVKFGHYNYRDIDYGTETFCAVGSHGRMDVRTFLQRYGTEAHRDIFGDNFWVEVGMRTAQQIRAQSDLKRIVMFTDVRFENEALAILDSAGEIWAINGPVSDTGDHASENPLPVPMVDRFIDNTVRDDAFSGLDAQLLSILDELGVASPNEEDPDRPHGDDRADGGNAVR